MVQRLFIHFFLSKIKNPSHWPIGSIDYFLEVPTDDEDLQEIASLLYSHERLAVIFASSLSENNVEFIMRVRRKRITRLHSISVPVKQIFILQN